MLSLECSIWELANLLQFIIFSLLCEMGESSSRFRIPKTSSERKTRLLSILFRNLRLQEQMGDTDFSRMARPKSKQDLLHWARRSFQGEEIGLDVQELTESTENMNSKSLNYWLCKFVHEVANKSGGRYPSRTLYNIVCGLTRFLVEKNGEGALNPLAVSDKKCRWKN